MKVILTEDIKGLGKVGERKDVPLGHANFLLLSKKAKIETEGALQDLKNKEASRQHQKEIRREDADLMCDRINGQSIDITADAGPAGVLHKRITSSKIGVLIKEKFGVEVDKRKITINGCDHGIKSLGNFSASVEFLPDVSANIFINVN